MSRVRGIPKDLAKLMQEHGFELVRCTKHMVWEHRQTGARLFTSITPRSNSTDRVRRNIRRALAQPYEVVRP